MGTAEQLSEQVLWEENRQWAIRSVKSEIASGMSVEQCGELIFERASGMVRAFQSKEIKVPPVINNTWGRRLWRNLHIWGGVVG